MREIAGMNGDRKSRLYVGLAAVLATLLGLAYIRWLEPLDAASVKNVDSVIEPGIAGRGLIDDEYHYLVIARNLSAGAGYSLDPGKPTALRVPGYPLYLSSVFAIFGPGVQPALVGNAALIALLPLLAFKFARQIFGSQAAVLAAFLCALDPGLYYLGTGRAYSEPLFAVLLCGGTVMWQKARRRTVRAEPVASGELSGARKATASKLPAGFTLAVVAGMAYAAAALTRTGYLGLPILIVIMEAIRRTRVNWKAALAMCAVSGLLLLPWALRNKLEMGTFTFSSTNDGITLLGTVLAAQQVRGDWLNPADVSSDYARIQHMNDEVARNSMARTVALAELHRIAPGTWFKVVCKRLVRLWIPLHRVVADEVSTRANIAVNVFYLPLMLLAIVGLVRSARNPDVVPALATCLYMTLLAAISWGGTRFRYGLEPLLVGFAAHELLSLRTAAAGYLRKFRTST
jgi:dolichyl-phosphate-mannose-protein mannosyltransferase